MLETRTCPYLSKREQGAREWGSFGDCGEKEIVEPLLQEVFPSVGGPPTRVIL